ncbi:MAG: pilus assembly protein [Rhodospirillales bacterium]|nr:pilus assembly protein [Rhodospirillales bacterium]
MTLLNSNKVYARFAAALPRITSAFSRFKQHQDGVAVVEFALVAPILVVLLLGMFEFSWLFFQRHNMLTTAERGARGVATQTLTAAEAIAESQTTLTDWNITSTVTIVEPDPANITDRDVVVRISAPTQGVSITGFFNFALPTNITVETFMRQEG